MLSIGKKIKELREEKGLSLRQLAERSGINHSVVSRTERGLTPPALETVLRILTLGLRKKPEDPAAEKVILETLEMHGLSGLEIRSKKGHER